jgi:hypothetical protein
VTAKAISIAAHYELDKKVSDQGLSVTDLAKVLGVNNLSLYRLLRVLEAHEIFSIIDDIIYPTELTPQLADVRSPHILRAYKAFDELQHTLETHQPAWNKVYGEAFYPSLNKDNLTEFAEWCQRSGDSWLRPTVSC